jgi:hypothetical protein
MKKLVMIIMAVSVLSFGCNALASLINPGFELTGGWNSGAENWESNGSALNGRSTAQAHTGTASMKISDDGATGGWGGSCWQYVNQAFAASSTMTANYWVKGQIGQGEAFSVKITAYDASWNILGSNYNEYWNALPSNDWLQISVSYNIGTVPVQWTKVEFAYVNGKGNSNGVYVDDVSLIPEPATLSFLGLGLLSLFVKRK